MNLIIQLLVIWKALFPIAVAFETDDFRISNHFLYEKHTEFYHNLGNNIEIRRQVPINNIGQFLAETKELQSNLNILCNIYEASSTVEKPIMATMGSMNFSAARQACQKDMPIFDFTKLSLQNWYLKYRILYQHVTKDTLLLDSCYPPLKTWAPYTIGKENNRTVLINIYNSTDRITRFAVLGQELFRHIKGTELDETNGREDSSGVPFQCRDPQCSMYLDIALNSDKLLALSNRKHVDSINITEDTLLMFTNRPGVLCLTQADTRAQLYCDVSNYQASRIKVTNKKQQCHHKVNLADQQVQSAVSYLSDLQVHFNITFPITLPDQRRKMSTQLRNMLLQIVNVRRNRKRRHLSSLFYEQFWQQKEDYDKYLMLDRDTNRTYYKPSYIKPIRKNLTNYANHNITQLKYEYLDTEWEDPIYMLDGLEFLYTEAVGLEKYLLAATLFIHYSLHSYVQIMEERMLSEEVIANREKINKILFELNLRNEEFSELHHKLVQNIRNITTLQNLFHEDTYYGILDNFVDILYQTVLIYASHLTQVQNTIQDIITASHLGLIPISLLPDLADLQQKLPQFYLFGKQNIHFTSHNNTLYLSIYPTHRDAIRLTIVKATAIPVKYNHNIVRVKDYKSQYYVVSKAKKRYAIVDYNFVNSCIYHGNCIFRATLYTIAQRYSCAIAEYFGDTQKCNFEKVNFELIYYRFPRHLIVLNNVGNSSVQTTCNRTLLGTTDYRVFRLHPHCYIRINNISMYADTTLKINDGSHLLSRKPVSHNYKLYYIPLLSDLDPANVLLYNYHAGDKSIWQPKIGIPIDNVKLNSAGGSRTINNITAEYVTAATAVSPLLFDTLSTLPPVKENDSRFFSTWVYRLETFFLEIQQGYLGSIGTLLITAIILIICIFLCTFGCKPILGLCRKTIPIPN